MRANDPPRQAIIFTHFGELRHHKSPDDLRDIPDVRSNPDDVVNKYSRILSRYLECDNIKIVYAYTDWAFKQAARKVKRVEDSFQIDTRVLQEELELMDVLAFAEKKARAALNNMRACDPPKIVFVGMVNLVNLLNSLVNVDIKDANGAPVSLTELLCGVNDTFTYDAPKFVEAVIRLRRHDNEPIIRIDEDAWVTKESIDHLVEQWRQGTGASYICFYSGHYGTEGAESPDILNDYAVRTHWLFEIGTPGLVRRPKSGESPGLERAYNMAEMFLADLSELGATQLPDSRLKLSKYMVGRTVERGFISPPRKWPQLISGAGLMMSRDAIKHVPPFMTFSQNTVWVDDFHKRRLHEHLEHLYPGALERVEPAWISQKRYSSLDVADMEWAKSKYFDRLLRGCMFSRVISENNGEPTPYTVKLKGMIENPTARANWQQPNSDEWQSLEASVLSAAVERYQEVIDCWSSQDYRDSMIYEWAHELPAEHCEAQCKAVTADAIGYVRLVALWDNFERAITRLHPLGNQWLVAEGYPEPPKGFRKPGSTQ